MRAPNRSMAGIQARAKLEEARRKRPDRISEADDQYTQMQQREQHEKLIEQAKEQLAKKDFARALATLKKAQEQNVDPREVQDLQAQVQ